LVSKAIRGSRFFLKPPLTEYRNLEEKPCIPI
jgi:hypothetical protein